MYDVWSTRMFGRWHCSNKSMIMMYDKIDELLTTDIIEKVDGPSLWVSLLPVSHQRQRQSKTMRRNAARNWGHRLWDEISESCLLSLIAAASYAIEQIFVKCRNVINYINDLIIFGSTNKEHDYNLQAVLKHREIQLNEAKCEFKVTEMIFLRQSLLYMWNRHLGKYEHSKHFDHREQRKSQTNSLD